MDTNVLANVHLYSLFMPQILNSDIKKVVFISSGHADMDLVNGYDIDIVPVYAATKAAMNMLNAKFSAQYKKDGVTFLSICPGVVDVGHFDNGEGSLPLLCSARTKLILLGGQLLRSRWPSSERYKGSSRHIRPILRAPQPQSRPLKTSCL
jgi:NAD(P)-dependent dehydrogenase (short-subunit alcohol dehydrogenase family)